MANSTLTNRAIYLDDFRTALSFENLRVDSIEWVDPEEVDHKCIISIGAGTGINIIEWTCHDIGRGNIKYFSGLPFREINIANEGVESGKIIIIVR
jgi:hypothetical protein